MTAKKLHLLRGRKNASLRRILVRRNGIKFVRLAGEASLFA